MPRLEIHLCRIIICVASTVLDLEWDEVASNSLFDLDRVAKENTRRGFVNIEWKPKDYLSFNGGIISEKRDGHESIQSYRVASNYQFFRESNNKARF